MLRPTVGPWSNALPPLLVKAIVIMDEGRICDYVVGAHVVTSVDEMTADSCPFDMALIGAVAMRLVNEVKGVNRVLI